MIEDDSMTMNVKWPVEEDRRDALCAMIEDCYKGFLSCNRRKSTSGARTTNV